MRTHRIGTVTTGVTLVIGGVLFIIHTIFHVINCRVIFALWPLILIGLGIEVLLSTASDKKYVYDKGGVFLLVLMSVFAMCMAGLEELIFHNTISFIHF